MTEEFEFKDAKPRETLDAECAFPTDAFGTHNAPADESEELLSVSDFEFLKNLGIDV